eukprot:SAG31_NODE_1155_length_9624_cov_3.380157_6_plen_248_part_00
MSVLWWHQVPRAAKYASTRRTELLARARAALGTDGVLLLKRCMCPEHDPFHRLIHVLLREKMTAAISDGPNCDQLVHYHPGRFDLSIDHRELESAVWGAGGSTGAAAPWMNLVGATMGRGALATVSGVFLAKSGASAEPFHIDTAHCSAQHEAAHSLQVLVALCDMPLEAGLVQVAVGSHTMTNHVQKPWLPIDKMLFKRRDVTQPRRPAPDHESMCAEVSPAILRDAEIAFVSHPPKQCNRIVGSC